MDAELALTLRVLRQFLGLRLGQRCGQAVTLAKLNLRDRDGDTACAEAEKAAHINKHGFDLTVRSHHNVLDIAHVAIVSAIGILPDELPAHRCNLALLAG